MQGQFLRLLMHGFESVTRAGLEGPIAGSQMHHPGECAGVFAWVLRHGDDTLFPVYDAVIALVLPNNSHVIDQALFGQFGREYLRAKSGQLHQHPVLRIR